MVTLMSSIPCTYFDLLGGALGSVWLWYTSGMDLRLAEVSSITPLNAPDVA